MGPRRPSDPYSARAAPLAHCQREAAHMRCGASLGTLKSCKQARHWLQVCSLTKEAARPEDVFPGTEYI
jgi:hypothetical protein